MTNDLSERTTEELYETWERSLAQVVHDVDVPLVAALEVEAERRGVSLPDVLAALTAAWDPSLHPRGHDGQFISIGGLIQLIGYSINGKDGKKKSYDGKRAKVLAINANPKDPDNPNIRVGLLDEKTGKPSVILNDIKPNQIMQAPEKARLDTSPDMPDVTPDVDAPDARANTERKAFSIAPDDTVVTRGATATFVEHPSLPGIDFMYRDEDGWQRRDGHDRTPVTDDNLLDELNKSLFKDLPTDDSGGEEYLDDVGPDEDKDGYEQTDVTPQAPELTPGDINSADGTQLKEMADQLGVEMVIYPRQPGQTQEEYDKQNATGLSAARNRIKAKAAFDAAGRDDLATAQLIDKNKTVKAWEAGFDGGDMSGGPAHQQTGVDVDPEWGPKPKYDVFRDKMDAAGAVWNPSSQDFSLPDGSSMRVDSDSYKNTERYSIYPAGISLWTTDKSSVRRYGDLDEALASVEGGDGGSKYPDDWTPEAVADYEGWASDQSSKGLPDDVATYEDLAPYRAADADIPELPPKAVSAEDRQALVDAGWTLTDTGTAYGHGWSRDDALAESARRGDLGDGDGGVGDEPRFNAADDFQDILDDPNEPLTVALADELEIFADELLNDEQDHAETARYMREVANRLDNGDIDQGDADFGPTIRNWADKIDPPGDGGEGDAFVDDDGVFVPSKPGGDGTMEQGFRLQQQSAIDDFNKEFGASPAFHSGDDLGDAYGGFETALSDYRSTMTGGRVDEINAAKLNLIEQYYAVQDAEGWDELGDGTRDSFVEMFEKDIFEGNLDDYSAPDVIPDLDIDLPDVPKPEETVETWTEYDDATFASMIENLNSVNAWKTLDPDMTFKILTEASARGIDPKNPSASASPDTGGDTNIPEPEPQAVPEAQVTGPESGFEGSAVKLLDGADATPGSKVTSVKDGKTYTIEGVYNNSKLGQDVYVRLRDEDGKLSYKSKRTLKSESGGGGTAVQDFSEGGEITAPAANPSQPAPAGLDDDDDDDTPLPPSTKPAGLKATNLKNSDSSKLKQAGFKQGDSVRVSGNFKNGKSLDGKIVGARSVSYPAKNFDQSSMATELVLELPDGKNVRVKIRQLDSIERLDNPTLDEPTKQNIKQYTDGQILKFMGDIENGNPFDYNKALIETEADDRGLLKPKPSTKPLAKPKSLSDPDIVKMIQQTDASMYEDSQEYDNPYYSTIELLDTRRDQVGKEIAYARETDDKFITLKVPSGSEQSIPVDVAIAWAAANGVSIPAVSGF